MLNLSEFSYIYIKIYKIMGKFMQKCKKFYHKLLTFVLIGAIMYIVIRLFSTKVEIIFPLNVVNTTHNRGLYYPLGVVNTTIEIIY